MDHHFVVTYRPAGDLLTLEFDAPFDEGHAIADAHLPDGYTVHSVYDFNDAIDLKACVKEAIAGEAKFHGDPEDEDDAAE